VFAAGTDFWREYDLPPQLSGPQLFLDRSFHLKPLAMLLGAQPLLGVALVDRQRARLFELRLDDLAESEDLIQRLPRRRSDGFAGYDAGHSERRVEEQVLHHMKRVAERLKERAERGLWEKLIVGCHDSQWPEFQSLLHSYVQQRVLGHFPCDVAAIKNDEIRQQAGRIFREWLDRRREEVVKTTIEQAKSNGRGVTGLRQVLRAIETGEAQTLIVAENYTTRAVQCTSCGRIDSHVVGYCALCGKSTRELDDVSEALVALAVSRDVELFYVKDNPELDRVGNIGALLRYRAGAAGAA
jgi:peptide subunit release factor 1 (eRF1)